ncbi:MAG: peptidase domain-containing ABC transporter [Pirellulaceae bacterium]
MANETPHDTLPADPAGESLHVLEQFSTSAGITFDRILASRVLSEAQRLIGGSCAQALAQQLVEVGESLNLRVRSLDGTLDEMLNFVRQGVPVATFVEGPGGDCHWMLIGELRGRRIRVPSLTCEGHDAWMSKRSLRERLGMRAPTDRRSWVIGQVAYGCEAASHVSLEHGGHKHVTPFARLIGLLRPERHDIWVILVFSVVVGILTLAAPIAVEALVNTVAFGRYLQPVFVLAGLLFTFLTFAAAIRGLITYVVEIIQRRLFIRVVEDLAYRLPRVRQEALTGEYGPELANRFFDVVTVQKVVASLLLDGIAIVLQTVIGMAVLAFYHPFLLGFDLVLLLCIGVVVFGLGYGAVTTAVKESRAKYALAAWLQELARWPTAFKLHAGSQFALDRADQLAVNWLDARRAHFRILMRQILFALGLQAIAATALLGLGGWLVINGELTLGQLVAAELIVMVIVGSFAKLGKQLENFYDLLAAVEKLGHLFDLPTEPHDRLFHLRPGGPAHVRVRDVTSTFGPEKAVGKLNLDIAPGTTVAVTGPPGYGKSTLVELLCGIRQPDAGHVELDGIDLREIRLDSLRDQLAVARSIEIFRGSIGENVHLNRPAISALDVRESLDGMGLLDEILKLPEGLNTQLQTNGAPLTTSQASRLMVARAIVGRPRLLLIDGTLDALPEHTLGAVLTSLTRPQAPWTLLVVTNRREVLVACQRIVLLGDRASTEDG